VSKFFIWYLLARATGSPLLSAIGLVAFYWAIDRYTLGVLPDPFRFLNALRRQWKLEAHLRHAPHDRKARTDLADVYLQRKKYAKAVDVLRPNLEAGDDDIATVFDMGVACLGAGHTTQGEKLLAHALEMQPTFRFGEIHLVLGRFRLQRGDLAGAKEALEQLIAQRKGSVEGRVLLSRALQGLGDDGRAALMRDAAWDEYVVAPRFQRRRERLWAWRARPSRPAMYGAFALVALFTFVRFVAPAIAEASSGYDDVGYGPYGAGAAPANYAPILSCTMPGACHELVDPDDARRAEMVQACRAANFVVDTTACSRVNVSGTCELHGGLERLVHYSGGAPDAADPQSTCAGTWRSGP
jgi:tetratricopeptide (TPR) repeat protein